jgi:hypothetical protein
MVTVKDAVKGAGQFVSELFPEAKNLRLEQVEKGGPLWRVVMSFQIEEPSGLAAVMGYQGRMFKEVDVDADTGKGTALRMWKN